MIMKRVRARGLTTSPVSEPTDFALLRTLAQIAPKSWTPAKEHRPEDDPQEGWQPAPEDGDSRSDDRGRTSHRGEVVAPQDEPVGRDVVDVVPHTVRGRFEIGVEPVDLLGDELRVKAIAKEDGGETNDGENGSVQGAPP